MSDPGKEAVAGGGGRGWSAWGKVAVVLGVLGVAAAGYLFLWPGAESNGRPAGDGPERKDGGVAVRTWVVQPEAAEERIFLNGSLVANEAVEIRSEVHGRVAEIGFIEGARVAEGDLLLKIDDRELQAQRTAAGQRLEFAKIQLARQQQLLAEGGTTQAAFDAALNERELTQAEYELVQVRLDKTEIRAPFYGRVGLRYVSPGAIVDTHTPLTTLQQTSPLKVDFPVPERHVARVSEGMSVQVEVTGFEKTFIARVVAIEPRIDPDTRTIAVRAVMENPDELLVPGAFAALELVVSRSSEAIFIPAIALRAGLPRDTVYTVREGKAEPIEVTTGLRTSERVQIIEGIAPGDEVIIEGMHALRPGVPVRVMKPAEGI